MAVEDAPERPPHPGPSCDHVVLLAFVLATYLVLIVRGSGIL